MTSKEENKERVYKELREAIRADDPHRVHQVLESRDEIDVNDLFSAKGYAAVKEHMAALHFACKYGNLKVIKHLIEVEHADINRPAKYGLTPLIYATRHLPLQTIQYLIEQGKLILFASAPPPLRVPCSPLLLILLPSPFSLSDY